MRDRLPVKVAARDHLVGLGEHERVVGRRRTPRSRAPAARSRARRGWRRAPAACSAASRRPAPCRSSCATRRCRCRRAGATGCARDAACPGCGRTAWMRGSNARGVPLSASSDMAPMRSASRAASSASRSASAPMAVMHCVPLTRLMPSLASKATGARPAFASARSPGMRTPSTHRLAFAHDHQRQVRQRRQVARGADRSLRRDHRVHAAVEHLAAAARHTTARTPEWPSGEHLRAQEHHRAHHRLAAAARRRRRRASG